MPRRKLLILLSALAVVLVGTIATASGGTSLVYVKGVSICKTPAHLRVGMNYCDAMRRIFVKAGTPGSRPYTPLSSVLKANALGPNTSTIGPAGSLTPADLRTAYGLSGTGSGQTVAIVDAYNDPNIAADLAHFDTQYGLTCSSCLTVANLGSSLPLHNNDTTGWSVEETLDVESAHGICPSCHLLLVEAKSPSNLDLGSAESYAASHGATEITNSFGGTETNDTTFQAAFNHPGIVITASTGDHGYYDWDKLGANGKVDKPQTPSAFNTVIAVGGTSLFLGATAARANETVWNENGPEGYDYAAGLGAAGGGCSTIYPAQTWQTHVANWSQTACGTERLDADIAAIADPVTGFDIYDSFTVRHVNQCTIPDCWSTEGGTSLASPVVAAIFALAGGAHGVQYPAATLYQNISSAYDVTSGGNGFCDGMGASQCNGLRTLNPPVANPNLWGAGIMDCAWTKTGAVVTAGDRACDAAKGYDGPSGVGAPNGLTMFQP